MNYEIEVENIKCGGCAASIRKQLLSLAGVKAVEVVVETGMVQVETDGTDSAILPQLQAALLKMGYPQTGSVEGARALGAKAKSFVSCAVGKLSQDESK
ncbi:MAG: heavy-metal-associated domain-containing protein [Thiotrichales bacterium]|nr:heavy-metal-associated domain-containing protein [Thiotrichales bacterium]